MIKFLNEPFFYQIKVTSFLITTHVKFNTDIVYLKLQNKHVNLNLTMMSEYN